MSPHINKKVSGRIRKIESRLWTSSISQDITRLFKKFVVAIYMISENLWVYFPTVSPIFVTIRLWNYFSLWNDIS